MDQVWITKYALTQGIFSAGVIKVAANGNTVTVRINDQGLNKHFHYHGKEWHRSFKAAVLQAEDMVDRKIKSLKKQITRLENLKFDKPV